MRLSVAIDGPAGAGKSTIAKIIGKNFNLMYINTGAMYRAITVVAIRNNITYSEIEKLCKLTDSLEMHFDEDKIVVNNEDLSDKINMPDISKQVSNYAAVSEIRERLVRLQRKMSEKYDVVMDGRDIGTVVLKDASFKFYLTASPEKRARRRFEEFMDKGINVDYEKILSDIIKRDYIDSHREVNPLTKAEDAIEIDSSEMTIEEVVDFITNCIRKDICEASGIFKK
ncbi:(d)CMP kinase [Clostridium pasteurianum]|uniref:Cytidylate kinase n=1 Tax=Clostridium pasteurianum BC1 TaxID=86416 RepID=R4K345_CLOPA|nr:(d)CMP kinase [Clostridium pasteurianum]AGK97522.1 cytidylate kinase [Clostridium pasteurianum BC1]